MPKITFATQVETCLYQQGYNYAMMGFDWEGLSFEYMDSRSFCQGYKDFVNQIVPIFDASVAPLAIYNSTGVQCESHRIPTSR